MRVRLASHPGRTSTPGVRGGIPCGAAAAALLACAMAAACGDNAVPLPPAVLEAGPVTLDTQTLTLTLGAAPALVMPQFLAIGEVAGDIDEARYYDPRGADDVTLVRPARAVAADGDWVVLEGGARLSLAPCAVPACAELVIDASAVPRAVQLQVALPRDPAEPLYGTGDAPRAANVAGSVRELALRIDPTSDSDLNETHVPVPLVMWPRRGAGMFIADDRPGALDLGAADPTRVTATFTLPARGAVRVLLFTASADRPLDLVRTYVALTAAPAVPPRWAFAPQQWRNVHDSTAQVLDDAAAMRARRIPGSVMWIDNPWQTAYNTFVIDEQRFAGIDAAIASLTAQGYKVMFWSTPYVGTTPATAADRAEGAAQGYFVTDDAGRTIDWPWQNGPGAMVDFTAPGATAWWQQRIARVVARGAAGFKLDFGEDLVPDIGGTFVRFLLADGDNASHHNRYAAGYHAAYLDALPRGDGFLISRAGAWGEQATSTAIWPGDLDSDFGEHGDLIDGKRAVGGLPSAIARGLGLSVSGYPFYGSDIGGFRGFPTTEALLRWAEYAALGTIMQLGGGGASHNPWDTALFDPGADVIYQRYADLHMRLGPLLWTLAQQAGADGTPVTRPARFVDDCACDDATFLLGDDIAVAPVVTAGATTRTAVLPAGRWFDPRSGATVAGRTEITVPAPLAELPMWFRVGSFVPMFARSADTLLPVTAAGVTSYADPLLGRELRLVYTPGLLTSDGVFGGTRVHDGTVVAAGAAGVTLTGGTEYTVITLDVDTRASTATIYAGAQAVAVDGVDLPAVASNAALEACAAPGCWLLDGPGARFQARVFAPTGQARSVVVR